MEVLNPVGIKGHLQGENIQSYNLFGPVMMITWWIQLGGKLPLGYDALLFSISGTGSFLTYQSLLLTQSWTTGGKVKEVKVLWYKADSNRRPVGPQSNTPTTRPPQVGGSIIRRVHNRAFFLLGGGGRLRKQPRHVQGTPRGPPGYKLTNGSQRVAYYAGTSCASNYCYGIHDLPS